MKQMLLVGLFALVLQKQMAMAGGGQNSFLDKKGFVASVGYSHTSIKAKFSDSELKHTGLTSNLTLGYKYENFLASLMLEGGDLKKDSSKIK
ncbi:MAG: hypothetical protein ACTTIC_00840 [Helicobacteraceae bacterium]